MIRASLRRARTTGTLPLSPRSVLTADRMTARFHGTNSSGGSQHEQVAAQMVQYALGHARSRKSGDSYDEAALVLEQGANNLRGKGENSDDAVGMIMIAMSTLFYERGKMDDAIEKLQTVCQLEHASLPTRVAAWEGLMGLNLESVKDVSSLVLVDDCFPLLSNNIEIGGDKFASEVLSSRVKAIKGLSDLVLGDLESAKLSFDGLDSDMGDCKEQMGNVALCNGEFLHCTGKYSSAKDSYEKVLTAYDGKDISGTSYLAAANMIPEELLLGATCALGQLASHSGNFGDAEDLLTKALNKAEDHFGPTHPKVGAILTCLALMYGHKAKSEASSSILIQEGLYRKAIDLLEAPAKASEVSDMQVDGRDIIALARGGYAELLCIQEKRKGEGERMRQRAESSWRNRRLSLADALADSPTPAVVDTRICRVL